MRAGLRAQARTAAVLLCLLWAAATQAQQTAAPDQLNPREMNDASRAEEAVRELAVERERSARVHLFGAALVATLMASALYFAVWAVVRQRSERASRENEARLRAIMSTAADGIVTIDEDGTIVSLNAAAERLFGRSEAELVGQDVALLMPEPDRSRHAGYLRRYLETGEARIVGRSREVPALRSDGRIVPVELRIGEFRRGERRFFTATLRDLTERKRAEAELRMSERRLADIAANFPGVIYQCVLSPDGRFSFRYVSDALEAIAGMPKEAYVAPAPLEEHAKRLAPEDRAQWMAALRRSAATLTTFDIERRLPTPYGMRWIRSIGRPYREPDGSVVWNGLDLDVTDRKQAEEHQELLMAELDHRVKNTLATVQAIAAQTLPPTGPHQAFAGRLAALAHTHSLLAQSRWEGARLADIVNVELAPYRDADGAKVSVQGGDVLLDPKSAQALALVVHELTTNAVKFGALSAPAGRVEVAWDVARASAEPWLTLEWVERGGPKVEPPAARGFGSLLIERSLQYELNGEVELDYRPEGVRCRIDLPLGMPIRRYAARGAASAGGRALSEN